MRKYTCKANQRRRLVRANHRKVTTRYRVYYRVVLAREPNEQND
ncbi:hypothetical protein QWY77_04835 [Thalassotalea ponticola]|nr:hypothetical protein [Thalassotalea ponticola]MDN3652092.1 hypothetical protein [Thalassotalea ponticola]